MVYFYHFPPLRALQTRKPTKKINSIKKTVKFYNFIFESSFVTLSSDFERI